MVRILKLVACLLILGFAVAACGGSSSTANTVTIVGSGS
jgi:hypothetical protein